MIEISVIMPNYNGAPYIGAAIESVINQQYQNWELLICDDCSTDNSIEIITKYTKDPRVKLLRNFANKGVSNCRNTAIAAAKGKYIAFLDSDDLWYPEKLKLQFEYIKANDINICYTDYYLMPEGEEDNLFLISAPKTISYHDLLKGKRFGILTTLLKKSILPAEPFTSFKNSEDFALWLTLLRSGEKAFGIPKPLASYRLLKKSRSSSKLLLVWRLWQIVRIQEKQLLPVRLYYFSCYIVVMLAKYKRILPKVLRLR